MDTHGARRYKSCTIGLSVQGRSMSFRTLLYRYFFFGWLFKDVNHGNLLQRAAAWRHNREQARWLPTYMRRWFGCGALLYGLGLLLELLLNAPGASVVFYVPSAMSVPINAVIIAAWVGLRVLPAPVAIRE
jgi:hypothetical protein